jgi:uncharacterized protein (DUF58 family)
MKRGRIQLRPTGLWLLFGPILGCIWLAAVNNSNNLIYGILYLIGSLTFVSIFHTWRNLALLEIEHVRVHPAFAGAEVQMDLHLRNPARHALHSLFFARYDEARAWTGAIPLDLPGNRGLRLQPGDTQAVTLAFPAGPRGRHRLEFLQIRTSYPFGLISARFRLPVHAAYFVYPEPKGLALFPEMRASGEEGLPTSTQPGDDFSGVRTYAPGESLRHVDWKAYARGRPLSVKQFTGGDGRELWLDAAELRDLPLEQRLSQLALWIVNAEKEDLPYAFKIGPFELPPGLGPDQSRRALEALALATPPPR